MALLTTQTLTYSGVNVTRAAVGGSGDTFTPAQNLFLDVFNGSGSPVTVTVPTPGDVRGQAITDISVSVPAGVVRYLKVSPPDFVRDPTTNLGSITYSATASVTIAVVQVQDT